MYVISYEIVKIPKVKVFISEAKNKRFLCVFSYAKCNSHESKLVT